MTVVLPPEGDVEPGENLVDLLPAHLLRRRESGGRRASDSVDENVLQDPVPAPRLGPPVTRLYIAVCNCSRPAETLVTSPG